MVPVDFTNMRILTIAEWIYERNPPGVAVRLEDDEGKTVDHPVMRTRKFKGRKHFLTGATGVPGVLNKELDDFFGKNWRKDLVAHNKKLLGDNAE